MRDTEWRAPLCRNPRLRENDVSLRRHEKGTYFYSLIVFQIPISKNEKLKIDDVISSGGYPYVVPQRYSPPQTPNVILFVLSSVEKQVVCRKPPGHPIK